MVDKDPREIVEKIMKDTRIAVLTYTDAQGRLVSTPMGTQDFEDASVVWFITGLDTDKVDAIRANPQVNVSYSSDDGWVSYSGTATPSKDKAKLDELWDASASAFMHSEKDDPRSGLLEVRGQTAEYWASDGTLKTAFEFAKGLVSKGDEPDMGDNDTIAL
ncbi:pyridoxamine 5'-phosphate oxidase family protein [Kytococcus sedentarius]|uniref:pyridoxamine 5'-phosphate oxidase family protein n=1 Tax=Kytococcus sedentarius TaxID=1276 RepID=UPI001950E827|nr:pyridoxamine 5'-phosphate oxidase family protein [Kytococcus sedentarius]QRO87502.1 pyridoxamine 5'-phosphate oxidase family protein [Kytococcus sedentarius]